ncbi:MAG: hypothetical protein MK000_04535 [Anaerolineales bacterium]|nr:hypothetical protein [Anaerolineales bacterium]
MTHINRNFLIAWLVHLLTASGLLWGFLATLAIIANDWKQALLWMSASVAADAIDGPISRIFRIQTVLPHFDGALLDTIVDFYTYVIVPVLFMYMAGLFPQDASVWVSILVLLVSGYQFCQKDAKTPDQYFKGFPSYWNVTLFYLLAFGWNHWVNLVIVILLCISIFVPIKYFYPTRTTVARRATLTIALLWGSSAFVVILSYPNAIPWALWGSFCCAIIYILMSIRQTLLDRK